MKRVALCLAFVIAFALQGTPSQQKDATKPSDHEQEAASPQSNPKPSMAVKEVKEPNVQPQQPPADEKRAVPKNNGLDYPLLGFWVNAALVVATFIIAIFAVVQARAAKASADALIVSQSAQLAVAPDNPIANINAGESPKIPVKVTNNGLTPAYNCVCETWIEILPEPFSDFTPKAVYFKLPSPMTIYTNAPQPTIVEVWLNRDLMPFEFSGLKSGHFLLCFRIHIEYRDAFKKRRWQDFGYVVRAGGMEYLPKYNDSG